MKKILATVLTAVLMLQVGICAMAAPTSVPTTGLALEVQPDIDLQVKKTGTSTWASTATILSGETVDVMASIDMTVVRNAFEAWYNYATQELSPQVNPTTAQGLPVTGTFNVVLEYPQGVTLPQATIEKTDLSDFNAATNDLFVANGARTVTGNQVLTIPVAVKNTVTVGTL